MGYRHYTLMTRIFACDFKDFGEFSFGSSKQLPFVPSKGLSSEQ